MGDVTQRPEWVSQGTEQGNNLVVSELWRQPWAAREQHASLKCRSACRTGTACEFEVPLGVGNSLHFEVTW